VSSPTEAELEALRGELFAHCYRMLGSVHEAEDLVQDTYLRAWQARDSFEGRASVRTWLYKIATNACLNALGSARRRVLPTSFEPEADPDDPVSARTDVPWLEPLPSSAEVRDSVRLAFVAMAQTLPPRQRAVLLLRDVLGFRAAEVAEMLDTTTIAVNSSLRRARSLLPEGGLSAYEVAEPSTPQQRQLLDAYVAAWEDKDVPAIVALMTADTVWEMPPLTAWYRGLDAIARHLSTRCPVKPGEASLLPVEANGQPAFATYVRRPDGTLRAEFLQVLDVGPDGIEHVYAFVDPQVFALFGLRPSGDSGPVPSRAGA
jgi:RNA polymerase sigma-70 factor (ECF subfamily)